MPKKTVNKIDRAEEAVQRLVGMFERDEIPEAVAETVIRSKLGNAPSAKWSLGNQLLMLLAGTTDARGFRQWEQAGRKVRKGAKAFYILGPMTRKMEDKETGETVTRVFGFKGVPVFAAEDTEGDEPYEAEVYEPMELPPLWDVAERIGVTRIDYGPFANGFKGYYQPGEKRIMLCSHDVDVFFHELAHAAHATIETLKGGQDRKQEIVAETVAATLCVLYGYEGFISKAGDYISAYAEENPARAIMSVLATVQKVLGVILGDGEEE